MGRHVGGLRGLAALFLYSLFHLCRHDHLWVLVHRQVPEGEEMLRSRQDQGLQISNLRKGQWNGFLPVLPEAQGVLWVLQSVRETHRTAS